MYNQSYNSLDEIRQKLMIYGWKQMEESMFDSAIGVSDFKKLCAMLWYNKYESTQKEICYLK